MFDVQLHKGSIVVHRTAGEPGPDDGGGAAPGREREGGGDLPRRGRPGPGPPRPSETRAESRPRRARRTTSPAAGSSTAPVRARRDAAARAARGAGARPSAASSAGPARRPASERGHELVEAGRGRAISRASSRTPSTAVSTHTLRSGVRRRAGGAGRRGPLRAPQRRRPPGAAGRARAVPEVARGARGGLLPRRPQRGRAGRGRLEGGARLVRPLPRPRARTAPTPRTRSGARWCWFTSSAARRPRGRSRRVSRAVPERSVRRSPRES